MHPALGVEGRHAGDAWALPSDALRCVQVLELVARADARQQTRDMLLDESESGQRLRQSTPFCGVSTPRERWAIYKDWSERAP